MLHNTNAEIYIPNGTAEKEALAKTTHMAISAHQDDIEIMAYDGIAKCFHAKDSRFFGVVVTNGAGSPRNGVYGDCTDEAMQLIRRKEQKVAADIGDFQGVALLDYSSKQTKDTQDTCVMEDIKTLIIQARPDVIYTHNLADKHDTHVAVAINVIKALRELPKEYHPRALYGCEVWRGLDWMLDEDKVAFDVDKYPNIASALLEVFDSQVSGGKRYDLATVGRRLANATYAASHDTDDCKSVSYAMDMTPLMKDKDTNIATYVKYFLDRLNNDIADRIQKLV